MGRPLGLSSRKVFLFSFKAFLRAELILMLSLSTRKPRHDLKTFECIDWDCENCTRIDFVRWIPKLKFWPVLVACIPGFMSLKCPVYHVSTSVYRA